MPDYEKRGYLESEFRLFHLTDRKEQDFQFHYHDFDKIIIFIDGNVNYIIEGKSYHLKPYDIILVNHNEIHKPDIDHQVPYERIIVYLSPGFIHSYKTDTYDLSECFCRTKESHSNVLRIHSLERSTLFHAIMNLESAFSDNGYANELYRQVLFLEFMIHLNRAVCEDHLDYLHTNACNEKIIDILNYINANLSEDLSIDALASRFYISKYHMMRLFKEHTGYTVGSYINHKRLLSAKEMVALGYPVTQICYDCGFKDYSTFSRAFRKLFGSSPSVFKNQDTSNYTPDFI
ncbi:AraC family transcriptional regulator [uncultured Robinsoniella sp.]|uniref:helix-turn-helix transcriptional regulator n=1 Tax=uncultured Robinsoniella sp. TaxID=904190 RepID=UPI00374F0B24